MGKEVNSDGTLGASVTRTTASLEFMYGVSFETVERKETNGTISKTVTQKTSFMGIISGETTNDLNTGKTTTSYNLDIGVAAGIGLYLEANLKIPFYKKEK